MAKNKNMSKTYKFIIIIFIVFIILLLISSSESQIMNQLDYNIVLNQDGSVTIVETWEIYIKNTNTLFRTFNKSSKYGDIINVNIKDLETGRNLTQINEEMYHVTTNCFYALDISSNKFEVAWGTGMQNKSGIKKYEFSYTITNVITEYNDCQEFYWKLLDSSNTIPVKKISGTIKLAQKVQDINKLRIWGHGPINGKIEKVANDRIDFYINNFRPNTMLELRAITEEKIFNIIDEKHIEYDVLSYIIQDEVKWAEKTNSETYLFYYILGAIYTIFTIINIFIIVRYYKISRKKDNGIVNKKIKYFREIPRKDATPTEAVYIFSYQKNKNDNNILRCQSDIVSAMILQLAHKKYINLKVENGKIYIKILKGPENLKKDENAVYELLHLSNLENEEYFELDNLKKFAKIKYYKYNELISKMINEARESLYKQKLVDKADKKKYLKCQDAKAIYPIIIQAIKFIIIAFLIGFIPWFDTIYINLFGIAYRSQLIIHAVMLFPLIVTFLIELKLKILAQPKIAVLTQTGTEEKEKWKALKRYLEEYSLINEKEVLSLAMWEEYLIYATALGIADKVIEQMKLKYPDVFVKEYWKDEIIDKYEIFDFIGRDRVYSEFNYNTITMLNDNTTKAYKTSLSEIASHYSYSDSGSGNGGGFSSGGRRTVADGMGRKIRYEIQREILSEINSFLKSLFVYQYLINKNYL